MIIHCPVTQLAILTRNSTFKGVKTICGFTIDIVHEDAFIHLEYLTSV